MPKEPTAKPDRPESSTGLGAQHFTDIADGLTLVANRLRERINAGGPYFALNDGLAGDLVLVADDLLALAAGMTSEAYIRALDTVAALPGGSGKRVWG
jgi:hypothetical protein